MDYFENYHNDFNRPHRVNDITLTFSESHHEENRLTELTPNVIGRSSTSKEQSKSQDASHTSSNGPGSFHLHTQSANEPLPELDFVSADYDADNCNHRTYTPQISPSGNSEEHDDADHEDEDDAECPSMRSRKRQRCPGEWKDCAAKKARNSGKAGVSRTGIPFNNKKMHSGCNKTCRFQCQTKINITERQTIFTSFWALEDRTRQWDYIARYTHTREPSKVKSAAKNENPGRRHRTHKFILRTSTKEVKVCSRMFLDTLGITRHWLSTVERKKTSDGQFISSDGRGSHTNRPKKIPPSVTQSVHDHIKTFPRVDSHYARARSNRQYLDENLNIGKMYRKYKEWMTDRNNANIASEHHYRDIFYKYNLSFHKPKKDQCAACSHFHLLTLEQKELEQEAHEEHINNKIKSRELMYEDKDMALEAETAICTACFDLQKVLVTPHSQTSVMYYKRKLAIYNFTVFEMAKKEGTCYIWNETIAKRGSNEISSCLWHFISEKIKSGIKDFRFYSDNCGGQNRNHILYCMYTKAAMEFDVKITHRYLEAGHTQNPGDSMHARIEKESENRSIFTQQQWCETIKAAKVNGTPYVLHELDQSQVLDFTIFAEKKKWNKIKISKLREINVYSDGKIGYKYRFDEELLYSLIGDVTWPDKVLQKAYKIKLPLDAGKKKDLQSLLDQGLIPSDHREFYEAILT